MWLTISLDVQKASAKNAYCIYGNPSPFAFIGFSHALCLKAGLTQRSGTLAIFHDIEFHAVHSKFNEFVFDIPRSAQRDTKSTRGVKGKTQLDMPMSELSVSLCFQFEASEYDGLNARLSEAISEMRFAGGVISDFSARVTESSDQAFKTKAGFVMAAATIDAGDSDVFNRMIEKISIQRGKRGWYSPSLVGFRLIEDPQSKRHGARGCYDHAYADPVIGVVEFKSSKKATLGDLWSIQKHEKYLEFLTPNLAALQETNRLHRKESTLP